MFWIHGGSFATGTARAYDGRFLAQKNVVVVTVNFRLQIFGYFDADGDGVMENLAMWDLRQALLWVRDNIEAFGGDMNRVTVFGGSSGAMVAGLMATAPPYVGLFHRVILGSGAAVNPKLLNINTTRVRQQVLKSTDCRNTDCLRRVRKCGKHQSHHVYCITVLVYVMWLWCNQSAYFLFFIFYWRLLFSFLLSSSNFHILTKIIRKILKC